MIQPYDEYADKFVAEHYTDSHWDRGELREALVNAWIAGLSHSLELLPEKKPVPFEYCTEVK